MSKWMISESKQVARKPTEAEYLARKAQLLKDNNMKAWKSMLDSVQVELLDKDGKDKHLSQKTKYEKALAHIEEIARQPITEWVSGLREPTDEEKERRDADVAAIAEIEKAAKSRRKERKERVAAALERANLTLADVRDLIEELNDGGQ